MVAGTAGEGGATCQQEAGRGCSEVPLPQGPWWPPLGRSLRLMTPRESRAAGAGRAARTHQRLLPRRSDRFSMLQRFAPETGQPLLP